MKTHGLIVDYLRVFDDGAKSLEFDDEGMKRVVEGLAKLTKEFPAAMATARSLFAGVSCFSHEDSKRYWQWHKAQGQQSLNDETSMSSAERERFAFMSQLHELLRDSEIDVILAYAGCKTTDPRQPINFWHWLPRAAIESKQARLAFL